MRPSMQLGGLGLSRRGSSVDPTAASIYNALKSWWTLDENAASPTYSDSHGANHLTQRNAGGSVNTSVNSTASALHGRGWFPNHTDNLTCYCPRSNTDLDAVDADFSFGGFFKSTIDVGTAAFLMGRIGGTTVAIDAYMYVESDNTVRASISHTDGSTANRITANSGQTWSGSAFQLICIVYDKTAGFVRIKLYDINTGLTVVSTSLGGNTIYTGASASNFCISEGLDSDANFFSGNRGAVITADECFYVNKALTDAEVTYLWNSSAGKSYANLVADAT